MQRSILVLAVSALFALASTSRGGFIITVSEVNGNVVAMGKGSLNTSALSLQSNQAPVQAVTAPMSARLEVGSPTGQIFGLGPVTGLTNFGTGITSEASMSNGDFAGIFGADNAIEVFHLYVSGTIISGSATWDNTTISGLGLRPGTYIYTWGSAANGTADFLEVEIAVPEPSTLTLFGIGSISLLGYGRRRRKHAAT
jgi:hypothetical protein